MDPNHLTPLPVRKQLHMSTHERLSYIDAQDSPVATPQPVTEIIDLSLDSDEETLALVSPSRVKTPLSSVNSAGCRLLRPTDAHGSQVLLSRVSRNRPRGLRRRAWLLQVRRHLLLRT